MSTFPFGNVPETSDQKVSELRSMSTQTKFHLFAPIDALVRATPTSPNDQIQIDF